MNVRLRRRGPLFVWGLAAVLGSLLGATCLVWARTEITNLRYRLHRLVEAGADLEAEVEKLRIEAAALRAPDRIERQARALGLVYPEPGQVVRIDVEPRAPRAVAAGPRAGEAQ